MESKQRAFFHLDRDLIVANDAARGPWSADACHAGPVTGVVARALERLVTDKQLVRMSLTFHRPVPMDGFTTEAGVEREGRRVTTATASVMTASGRTCAVAHSLHVATESYATLPTATVPAPDFSQAREGSFPLESAVHGLPFFGSGVEVAYPPGETPEAGPTILWMRALPIMDGEQSTPFQSLCPLADCGNGISRNSNVAEVTFVNPDLTINVFRLPQSDWLASSALSFWEPSGVGLSQAQLFDTKGPIGFALQSLIIRPLEK